MVMQMIEEQQQGDGVTTSASLSGKEPRGYRELPHNLDLEMVLLGAVLRDNKVLETIGDDITSECFYAGEHQRIFSLLQSMIGRGQTASPASLGTIADHDPLLKAGGGSGYLYELAGNLAAVVNPVDYASQIRDLYLKRQLIEIGEAIVNVAHNLTDFASTAEKQIELAEARLYQLAATGVGGAPMRQLGKAVVESLTEIIDAKRRGGKLVGVTTGLRDVDRSLGGLHRSDLVILAGRPGMGKTALATNMSFNAAHAWRREADDQSGRVTEEGAQILFFSLEMSANQLASRILSERAHISSDKMRRGDIVDEDVNRIGMEAARLREIPFYIDDTPALSITAMRQRARRVQRQYGLGMIVVDYLQLIAPPPDRQSENRVQEVSEITRGLKAMARELNVPVLALSQLSRAVESREDQRPMLSDLRESGSIEQDADVVMFVYREDYYSRNKELKRRDNETEEKFTRRVAEFEQNKREHENLAELLIEKNRHGPAGKVRLYFDKAYTKFTDLDRTHS